MRDNTNTGQSNKCINSWNWQDSDLYMASGCKTKCVGWYQYQYGYNFKNPSKEWLSWDEFIETFGVESIFATVDVCIGLGGCIPFLGCLCAGYVAHIPTGIPDPIALGVMFPVYTTTARPGRCTGMSNTSLRFYYNNKKPSDFLPSAKKVSDLNLEGQVEFDIDSSQGAIISKEIAEPYLNYQYLIATQGKTTPTMYWLKSNKVSRAETSGVLSCQTVGQVIPWWLRTFEKMEISPGYTYMIITFRFIQTSF